jgi:hypothetical protein
MRFMMMIKTAEGTPPNQLRDAIGKLSGERSAAGILLQTGGLGPSARRARVRVSGAKLGVTDGPFAETKELIGGFTILKASERTDVREMLDAPSGG